MTDGRWYYQQPLSIEEVMADTQVIIGVGRSDYFYMLDPPELFASSGFGMVPLFKLKGLTPKSIGAVFTANVPPEYVEFVINNVLKTGINDPFWTGWGFAGWHDDEAGPPTWNFTEYYKGNGFDFYGHDIDYITLSLNNNYYSVNYYVGEGYTYGWSWNATITVYGHAQVTAADIDKDGDVDGVDLQIFSEYFGTAESQPGE